MWAPTGIHGGFSAELVANIKKCVSIPVITVGRYTEPQFAEQIIKMGNADLVAFGRQSLADPHTPQKAMEEDWKILHHVSPVFRAVLPICMQVNQSVVL